MEVNRIYTESNLITLEKMPNELVMLTVTSPPYDELRSYESVFSVELLARKLLQKTKQGGACVWVVADQTKNYSETGTSFRQAIAFMEAGWKLYDTMIWKKKNHMPGGQNRYADGFEYMFVFTKGNPAVTNLLTEDCVFPGRSQTWATRPHESKIWAKNGVKHRVTLEKKTRSNVWEYAVGLGGSTSDKIAFQHPAIFPEALARDHILSWSNPGDIVYDCFAGSGTVGKMAYLYDRDFILSEISPVYSEISRIRLEPYLSQTKLKIY